MSDPLSNENLAEKFNELGVSADHGVFDEVRVLVTPPINMLWSVNNIEDALTRRKEFFKSNTDTTFINTEISEMRQNNISEDLIFRYILESEVETIVEKVIEAAKKYKAKKYNGNDLTIKDIYGGVFSDFFLTRKLEML